MQRLHGNGCAVPGYFAADIGHGRQRIFTAAAIFTNKVNVDGLLVASQQHFIGGNVDVTVFAFNCVGIGHAGTFDADKVNVIPVHLITLGQLNQAAGVAGANYQSVLFFLFP